MADFTWTNAAGGDWSVASNWSPSILNPPPPGTGDNADFNDLATGLSSGYTVTVQAGTVVAAGLDGVFITIDAISDTKDVAFSISGSLTADIQYVTNAGGPATSFVVEAGGSLFVPTLLAAFDTAQTVTISGKDAGGHLELGDLTVGALPAPSR